MATPMGINDAAGLARSVVADLPRYSISGEVIALSPTMITISDRQRALTIGARVEIETETTPLLAEVCRIIEGEAIALPLGRVDGVKRGAIAHRIFHGARVNPTQNWLGRIVDGLGQPIDGGPPLARGLTAMPLKASPPLAPERDRLGGAIDFGVPAIDLFASARQGQRLGLFSGSGIGKSSLMAMIARNTDCDISVIALIGERGREVREFIEDSLGPEGLARSFVVVATSDQPSVVRRDAAFLAMAVAEYFRDGGAHVLCMMDSITRIATAQREIGLAAGEPPTTRGYTPSVFSLLPSLLERAGPGVSGKGAISGVFTVLVEGDDHDEPIADAARAILDGHVVLDRRIAERGRLPAIDVLKSVSRATAALNPDETSVVAQARSIISTYEDMREMIRIGAYQPGANPEVDRAIAHIADIEKILAQDVHECIRRDQAIEMMRAAIPSNVKEEN